MRKTFSALVKSRGFEAGATALCIGILGAFFYTHRTQISTSLDLIEPDLLIFIFITIGAQILCRTLRDKLLYDALGYRITCYTIYHIHVKQNLLNYLPFKPGTVYAASTLKARYEIDLSVFAAVYTAQSILTLGIALLVGAAAIGATSGSDQIGVVGLLALLGLMTTGLLAIRTPRSANSSTKIMAFLLTIQRGMQSLSGSPGLFFGAAFLGILAILLNAWRLQALLSVSGIVADFPTAIIFAVSMYASLFVAITPAGIGIREAIVGATAGALSVSPVGSIIASGLDRIFVIAYCGFVVIVERVLQLYRIRPK